MELKTVKKKKVFLVLSYVFLFTSYITLLTFHLQSTVSCFLLYEYWEAQTYCYIVLFTLQKKKQKNNNNTNNRLVTFSSFASVLLLSFGSVHNDTHFLEKQKNKKGVMRCHELYTGFRKLKPSYSQEKTRVKVRFSFFFFSFSYFISICKLLIKKKIFFFFFFISI